MALGGSGHDVFVDLQDLPAGGDYHTRIRKAISVSDVFVFLISPHSLKKGAYSLTELQLAKKKWPNPWGAVLPVLLHHPDEDKFHEKVDKYLNACTILKPVGNVAAEVAAAVEELQPAKQTTKDVAAPVRPHTGALERDAHSGQVSRSAAPAIVLGLPELKQNTIEAHPAGLYPPGLGMRIRVPGTISNASGKMLQLIARFAFQNGVPLIANAQEVALRDTSGVVATCSQPASVGDHTTLEAHEMAFPYFALNLQPTNGMMTYYLVVVVTAYLDNLVVAQSAPTPFVLRW